MYRQIRVYIYRYLHTNIYIFTPTHKQIASAESEREVLEQQLNAVDEALMRTSDHILRRPSLPLPLYTLPTSTTAPHTSHPSAPSFHPILPPSLPPSQDTHTDTSPLSQHTTPTHTSAAHTTAAPQPPTGALPHTHSHTRTHHGPAPHAAPMRPIQVKILASGLAGNSQKRALAKRTL